ncbi:hypothetical protein RB195_010363 [Necator americanus]|uniref:Uncharacterized protein n=1 Tax=Necator americanus TaxID=51031 RepID=A0ABR1CYR8_NECAM
MTNLPIRLSSGNEGASRKCNAQVDFCGTNERQDSKRVSIDESEARSMLRRKASEREATLEDVSTDDDVGEYIRDVMKREFRGECDQVTVRQLNHHPEAVFNKTLKLVGPEKTVYVHLRNRVKTSCKQEDQGTVEEQPTELFWPEDQYARRLLDMKTSEQSVEVFEDERKSEELPSKSSQEREELHRHKVNDSVAHTKASSWTGPHYPVPRTTSVLSWRESSRNYNYHDEYAYRMGTQVQRMIDDLIWRINRGDPLDREDLHALKEIHLARVAPDEAELFSLLQYRRGQDEQHISHLREILEKWYLTYEDLLEAAQPFNSITAIIAHLILLADAYFFHARIVASESVQRKLYRRSIGIYNDLLNQAKRSLHSTDVSLLSVVERISQILRESHIQEPALVLEITTILDKAETDLKRQPEGMGAHRRIGRARENVAALGSYYYFYF